jgi:hypothetical protein
VNVGRTLFSQICGFVPWTSFERLVKYGGDVRVRKLPCTEQFRAMAFAQMTYRESLRDSKPVWRTARKTLRHGFRKAVAKLTLADANERRDWRLWHGLAAIPIGRAEALCGQRVSGSTSIIPYTRSTAQPSISVFRYFPGPIFARPKQP